MKKIFRPYFLTLCILTGLYLPGCNFMANSSANQSLESQTIAYKTDTAIFGAGCFWCVEAIFQRLEGVISVQSGYAGGKIKNPTYKDVCSGLTGHAEVVLISFNPKLIGYEELLEIFWKTHDPTTLNRQGADVGSQYRSVIFYMTEEQQKKAIYYKEKLNTEAVYPKPVITEISPFNGEFYPAEDYHQNYFNQNSNQPYCKIVIVPKLEKFENIFSKKLKKK